MIQVDEKASTRLKTFALPAKGIPMNRDERLTTQRYNERSISQPATILLMWHVCDRRCKLVRKQYIAKCLLRKTK